MDETFGHGTKPVVVCTDGGEDGDRALRFAIEEAGRRNTGVRVVHVLLDVFPYALVSALRFTPGISDIGNRILREALNRSRELRPDLEVDGALVDGPLVQAIVRESSDAACVVIGTREWKRLREFGGSTSAGVASHAACPVIAVPPAWTGASSTGRVVVGVDAEGGPHPSLRQAFDEARRRGAVLEVVHAWTPPHLYEPALGNWDAAEWRDVTAGTLAELIAPVGADFPDVKVDLVVSQGDPAFVLTEAAGESDLLILGRHRNALPFAHRLGSLAYHALQAATSPLEIVPLTTHRAIV